MSTPTLSSSPRASITVPSRVGVPVAADVLLGPSQRLGCHAIERIVTERPSIAFDDDAFDAMSLSHNILQSAQNKGRQIYGLTTGFGPHVRESAECGSKQRGEGLIAHLGAGWGRYAERDIVRATLAVRCQALAQGRSGIEPCVAEAFLALLNHDICPAIPEIGSVGASGDLIPLAHAARVLCGEGQVLDDAGGFIGGGQALKDAGLEPLELSGRDALALVNGTSFMTGYAALAAVRADRLLRRAEDLTGLVYRALGCREQALDPRLHQHRGHPGQVRSAERIAAEAEAEGPYEDATRPLQEVYSLRCAPQFLGACRDQIEHATRIIEREINGVNDNPVICGTPEDPAVLHGGNFQGQQIAFAADVLNQAMVQIGIVIERQLDVLCNPYMNDATLLLAWQPGATSGLAGAQITATALIAEMRHAATPGAIASIPTNERNQDVVSMGTMAARHAFEQTGRLSAVLATQAIAVTQLDHLREHGRAKGARIVMPEWMPPIAGFDADRPLHEDIERVGDLFLREG